MLYVCQAIFRILWTSLFRAQLLFRTRLGCISKSVRCSALIAHDPSKFLSIYITHPPSLELCALELTYMYLYLYWIVLWFYTTHLVHKLFYHVIHLFHVLVLEKRHCHYVTNWSTVSFNCVNYHVNIIYHIKQYSNAMYQPRGRCLFTLFTLYTN